MLFLLLYYEYNKMVNKCAQFNSLSGMNCFIHHKCKFYLLFFYCIFLKHLLILTWSIFVFIIFKLLSSNKKYISSKNYHFKHQKLSNTKFLYFFSNSKKHFFISDYFKKKVKLKLFVQRSIKVEDNIPFAHSITRKGIHKMIFPRIFP